MYIKRQDARELYLLLQNKTFSFFWTFECHSHVPVMTQCTTVLCIISSTVFTVKPCLLLASQLVFETKFLLEQSQSDRRLVSINQSSSFSGNQAHRKNTISNTRSCDSNKKMEKLQNCTNYRKKLHIMKPAEIIIVNIFIISGNNTHINGDKQITADRRKHTE